MTSQTDDRPDFGPRGYLPQRAAQRARKIVLREQMGLGWPLAAATAAVVVAAVGAVFLLTRDEPPAPPYTPAVPLEQVDPRGAAVVDVAGIGDVLVVRAGGGVQVFGAPERDAVYCPASGRLEAPGAVWNLNGRRVGGDGPSLQPVPTDVHGGTVYVDPTRRPPPPSPLPAGEQPACVE